MSTSTYLQLCKDAQAVCEISGAPIVSVENQTGILADLVRWVADADIAIQREAINWNFLYKTDFSVSTVAGVANYNKPPTIFGKWDRRTFYLDYTTDDNVKLTEMDYRAFYNSQGRGVQEQNQPANFVIQPNENIILYSVPDAAYTLTANYWRNPLRMVANGDFSLIPEAFIRCIMARTKVYYAEAEETQFVYETAVAEYDRVLSELKSDQLPGWEGYRVSDDVQMTVSTDGFTGTGSDDGSAFEGPYY